MRTKPRLSILAEHCLMAASLLRSRPWTVKQKQETPVKRTDYRYKCAKNFKKGRVGTGQYLEQIQGFTINKKKKYWNQYHTCYR
jgi:hypothetical protein